MSKEATNICSFPYFRSWIQTIITTSSDPHCFGAVAFLCDVIRRQPLRLILPRIASGINRASSSHVISLFFFPLPPSSIFEPLPVHHLSFYWLLRATATRIFGRLGSVVLVSISSSTWCHLSHQHDHQHDHPQGQHLRCHGAF